MTEHDYTRPEVTVHWDPTKCIHSAHCVRSLPAVFQPMTRPWVKIHGADAERIMQVIDGCPSGALRYTRHEPGA
ncbi:MAG: (4Fe-4S)-binding protein [Gemmatimonadales bacterium]|nr:(4Fe-4S)-binding protein [Gemmatimonadales bacterium]